MCLMAGWPHSGKAAQRQAERRLGGVEATRRAAALAGGFQAASYHALVEGLRARLRAAGGEAVEVDEAAYDDEVLSPVNGFITATRARATVGAGCAWRRDAGGKRGGVGGGLRAGCGLQAAGWRESGVF